MASDTRNTQIVIALIATMTIGAGVLHLLEPSKPRWGGESLLMAETGQKVSSLLIEYAPPRSARDFSEYDCVILQDGQVYWNPKSPNVRLVVMGTEGARLADAQAKNLLAAIGTLNQSRGLNLGEVVLDPASDPTQNPTLSAQASDLRTLLVRKGFIR